MSPQAKSTAKPKSAAKPKTSTKTAGNGRTRQTEPEIGSAKPNGRPETEKTVLVLQGGGALGSYQAGAYEALAIRDHVPDWVAGMSIGAINAALIAGNLPDRAAADLLEPGVFPSRLAAAARAWRGPLRLQRDQRLPRRALWRPRILSSALSLPPALSALRSRLPCR